MLDDADYLRRKSAGESAAAEAESLAIRSRLSRLNGDQVRFELSWNDIQVQEPIGYGGFSQVFKVQVLPDVEKDFALKCLNPQTRLRSKTFRTGAVDLAIEGEILSRLDHENVIKLHGVYGAGPLQSYMDTDRGYFLVLDMLDDTLASKLEKYRAAYKTNGRSTGLSNSRALSRSSTTKHTSQSAVLERVSSVAMGVAKGMEYLHTQGVALRDLKPDNVGFDAEGTPKIFDLGFAREEHTIRSTEVAGSLRYMAPEVASGQGSLLASDVYSFGVLLWELCTLEKPYKHINSRDEFMETVIVDAWRHSTSAIPSSALRKLVKECWQTDPRKRPTFAQIVKKLRVELTLTKTVSTTKNKGFGSSLSLKRTATWTAKKLSSGLSSSSFGILRVAFGSGSSINSKRTEATWSSSSGENEGAAQASPGKKKQNATFDTTGATGTGNRNSLFALQKNTILELPNESSTTPESHIKATKSIVRGLPSCPEISLAQS